jgi:sn-glycerol 3-phosphate transport system ATP-binding protein
MAQLVIEKVTKSFGDNRVLQEVDLDVADGEMIVIVGASGCGKSTLLRIVAGLETATTGSIRIDEREVNHLDPAERDIAMVFQNYALYPHMTVKQNMAYGLKIRGTGRDEIDRRVKEAADVLEIGHLLDRRPRQLSGGQRQRVAMGRAIVREPKLFLFDEPLSNLDAKLRVLMRAEIRQLQKRLGVTSLYVTHDQTEAMTLGDRLVVMHKGVPAQIASPVEVWARPADTYVASFIGSPSMNLIDAVLADDGQAIALKDGTKLALSDGRRPGGNGRKVVLGVRPEHVLRDQPNGIAFTVDLVEPLGSETVVHGRIPSGDTVMAKFIGFTPPGQSMRLAIGFSSADWHLFDQETGKRLDPI